MADLMRKGINLEELVNRGLLTLKGSEYISFSQRCKNTKSMAEETALRLADRMEASYASVKRVSGNSGRDRFQVTVYSL